MRIRKLLLIKALFFSGTFTFGQVRSSCDSAKLKVNIINTIDHRNNGGIEFIQDTSSDWRVFFVGPTKDQTVIESSERIFKNLPKGHYDAVLYDKSKKYCSKHFKILIQ